MTSSATDGPRSSPDTPGARARLLRGGAFAAGVVGLGVAGLLGFALPSAGYRATAIVSVADATSPLASVLPRAVAGVAVSAPVLQRAAEGLVAVKLPAPAPSLVERALVALDLQGTHATSQVARLITALGEAVSADPGETPGTLDIGAQMPDAAAAAQVATVVAQALVADRDDALVRERDQKLAQSLARLDRLKAAAAEAHRRLAALGAGDADAEQARAAAALVAAAQARVDAFRTILASGAPPLSDRHDVPSSIDTLQTSYLDLTRQLAKARETLGDRHTTIIALQAEVRHAAASLTAEWRRLAHMADNELVAARARLDEFKARVAPLDPKRRAAVEDARRLAQIADADLARAQALPPAQQADDRPYFVLQAANVPAAATGIGMPVRLLISALAGMAAILLIRRLPGLTLRPVPRHSPERAAAFFPEAVNEATSERTVQALNLSMLRRSMRKGRSVRANYEPNVDVGAPLARSLDAVLDGLAAVAPHLSSIPTVLVATNEPETSTLPTALALARAAVRDGQRVLLVEATQEREELARVADPNAEPAIVDLFGTLRVVLPAEEPAHDLYLAPDVANGARIASALARDEAIPLIDELETEFDLVVIDGGYAAESAAAGWTADRFIRVGDAHAGREDAHLATTFGTTVEAILGTVVGARFKQRQETESRPAAPEASLARRTRQAPPVAAVAPRRLQGRRSLQRRRVAAR